MIDSDFEGLPSNTMVAVVLFNMDHVLDKSFHVLILLLFRVFFS